MTAPVTNTQPSTGSQAIETARSLPRWALILIVGGAGILTWWLIKNYQTSTTDSWTDQATALLTSRGYTNQQIQTALTHYYQGGMTTQEQDMIGQAIRALGTPDMPENRSTIDQPPTEQITPIATYSDTQPVNTSDPAVYWYVTSIGVGWTSSFRGIAQQLYGDPNLGYLVQQNNPGLANNDYTRLPVGTRIKLPRSAHA